MPNVHPPRLPRAAARRSPRPADRALRPRRRARHAVRRRRQRRPPAAGHARAPLPRRRLLERHAVRHDRRGRVARLRRARRDARRDRRRRHRPARARVLVGVAASRSRTPSAQARQLLRRRRPRHAARAAVLLQGAGRRGAVTRWFSDVLERCADARDVIVYHIPSLTAVPLSIALIGRLKRAFPGVVTGVKDSSGDWPTTDRLLAEHRDLHILVGDERLLARAVRHGGSRRDQRLLQLLRERLAPMVETRRGRAGTRARWSTSCCRHPGDAGGQGAGRAHRRRRRLRSRSRRRCVRSRTARARASTPPGIASSPRRAHDLPGSRERRRERRRCATRPTSASRAASSTREIRAGQFVSQRELTEITGMPLGAIRELMPRLEADGLIRTVPQRGMQVAQVDVRLIRDAFGFRILIEREAAAAFAQRAPDAAFAKLAGRARGDARRGGERASRRRWSRGRRRVDDGMHATIVDALDNEHRLRRLPRQRAQDPADPAERDASSTPTSSRRSCACTSP